MRTFVKWGATGLVVATIVASAPAAFAGRAQTRPVSSAVQTIQAATATLTLTLDNGRIEADLEVHTGVAGQVWRFRMKDNGVRFARGHKTTEADGSFSVTRRTTNQAGTDTIVAIARNTVTGEIVKATATI